MGIVCNMSVVRPDTYEQLLRLPDYSFELYLTGSRAFGAEKSESDFDFYAHHCCATERDLYRLNWELLPDYRTHVGIVCEYRTIFERAPEVHMKLHVMLVKSMPDWVGAQELLLRWGHLYSNYDKKQREQLWQLAVMSLENDA
jgi:hypothetical protein